MRQLIFLIGFIALKFIREFVPNLQSTKYLVSQSLKKDELVEIKMEVELVDKSVSSGYHVDNILLDFSYSGGNTGYIATILPFVKPGMFKIRKNTEIFSHTARTSFILCDVFVI